MIHGNFILWPGEKRELIIPNSVVGEGELQFLKTLTRADLTDIAAGGNWYLGLCGDDFDENTVLATLVGEPSAAGGYARKAVTRDAVGWPTIGAVNGVNRIRSATVTWAPSGAAYDEDIQRVFLTNAAAGTVGILYSVSGAFPSAIHLADGASFPVAYELYLR